jgi:hypothetical protein
MKGMNHGCSLFVIGSGLRTESLQGGHFKQPVAGHVLLVMSNKSPAAGPLMHNRPCVTPLRAAPRQIFLQFFQSNADARQVSEGI